MNVVEHITAHLRAAVGNIALATILAVLTMAAPVAAQTATPSPTASNAAQSPTTTPTHTTATQADSVTVSLVTFYPGDESFSIYGHTELRVQRNDIDWYFNYGVFDFESKGFVWRFVTGDAEYLCVPLPAKYAKLDMQGRRMVEQRLNLTPDEARDLASRLTVNALPDNRSYHYRYLTDNCSTRPRDMIEWAVNDDSLEYGASPQPDVTYRQMMRHYGRNYAWQQFGIDLVLGSGIDRPLTYREQMFIPMVLMQAAEDATVRRNGHVEPLVQHTEVVVDTSEQGLVLPPTPWWCSPLAAALLVLGATMAISLRDVKRRRVTRWADTVLYSLLAVMGSVIAFLVCCSEHEALWPNWNLLWAHPLAWFPAVAVWSARLKTALRTYHWANAVLLVATLALWPLLPQVANAAFFPLMAASAIRSASYIVATKKK